MAFAAPAPIGEFALRVLVCEDDAAQRELMATWLAAEGVIVETAEDGRQALERARATPPDAVVADWLMPGLDGITLVGELQGRPRARRRLHRRRDRPRRAGVRAPRGRRRRRPRPGQAARAGRPRGGRRRRRAPRAGPAPPPRGLPHRTRPPACATPARSARTPSGCWRSRAAPASPSAWRSARRTAGHPAGWPRSSARSASRSVRRTRSTGSTTTTPARWPCSHRTATSPTCWLPPWSPPARMRARCCARARRSPRPAARPTCAAPPRPRSCCVPPRSAAARYAHRRR